MKKWHSTYILLLAGVMSVGFGQALAMADQQATETVALQTTQGQVQIHQSQGATSQSTPTSSSSSELGGTNNPFPTTNASGLFGGDTCRLEKIEVTPCQ